MRTALRIRADGVAGLRIDASCTNLIREMEAYSWHEGDADHEKHPEKRQDHAVDALRYAVTGLRRAVKMQMGTRV